MTANEHEYLNYYEMKLTVEDAHPFKVWDVWHAMDTKERANKYPSMRDYVVESASIYDANKISPELGLVQSAWLDIGSRNTWISEAYDPPFGARSFVSCYNATELLFWLMHGNWGIGNAFILGNLCFINQVNGGDEWLVIKDDYSFESFTWELIVKQGGANAFYMMILDLQTATREQCKGLKYTGIFLKAHAISEWPYPTIGKWYREGNPAWKEVNEDTYDNQLGCVPLAWMRDGCFAVGEAYCHNEDGQPVYAVYVKYQGKFFAKYAPLNEHNIYKYRTEIKNQTLAQEASMQTD